MLYPPTCQSSLHACLAARWAAFIHCCCCRCCCRDAPRLRTVTAGLLQAADAPRVQPGRGRSTVLLVGRLLVGVMLLVAGYMQVGGGRRWGMLGN
jgi:hypothetical protein